MIVERWARVFCRSAPKLSGCSGLSAAVGADAALLEQLHVRWTMCGTGVPGIPESPGPVVALREVELLLCSPDSATTAASVARLEASLGAEKGTALAVAVQGFVQG